MLTKEQLQELAVPDGAVFRVDGVEKFGRPHPYCIGTKHLEYADSSILDETSIRRAEKRGAKCCVPNCRLPYDEHTTETVLIVVVQDAAMQKDLNKIPGLVEWLTSIKEKAVSMGVEGFAFPTENQRNPKPNRVRKTG